MRKIFASLALILLLVTPVKAQGQNVSGIGTNTSLPMTCSVGTITYLTSGTVGLYYCSPVNTWAIIAAPGGGGSIPSGLITLVTSGTCATGWSEVSALNGKMLRGTVTANGNVGTTGGNDTITPTVATLTAAAQIFTGTPFTDIINHTHAVNITDPGHNHTQNSFAPRIINSGTAGTVGVQGASSASNANASNAATTATNQSNTTGITATTSNPSGGVSSITPAGTNGTSSVTGTLNSFDNRPAYINVIFCSKD